METPFLSSNPGRVILLAAAVFLFSFAAFSITGSIYPLACGMPVGITLSFVAVGVGLEDHVLPTLYTILLMPPALWGFYFLTAHLPNAAGFGYAVGVAGLLSLGKAAVGGSKGKAVA